MKMTQACLSPWQIDLTDIFCSKTLQNATAEHLCRLESFLHVYCLFDRVFIPEKYRTSPFIKALDPDRSVFVVDSEISGSLPTNSDGHTVVNVDPTLLFKNEKHLKLKSKGWLQQHLTFDIPRREREALVEEITRFDKHVSLFHRIILAEYDTQWALAIRNDAFLSLFASTFQIYWPDLSEISHFLAYLEVQARKAGAPAQPGGLAGTFNFEFPSGAVQARIDVPAFLEEFSERARGENPVTALQSLRQSYESCREAFRPVADEITNWRGSELVVSRMTGPELTRWNQYVRGLFGAPKEGLLLRSEIAAVQLNFGSISADFYHGIREQIQAQTTLLRFAPYQSFSPGARPALDLSPLNIKDVFPFQRRLFRMGRGYKNKRGIAHKGLGAVVSFPLYVDAQLPQASLKDSAVQERSAHLYLICTRPKITVSPDIRVHRDGLKWNSGSSRKLGRKASA